jgi:hypothetical protein
VTDSQELADPFDQAVAEAMDEMGDGSPTEPLDPQPGDETEILVEEPAEDEGSEQAEIETEPPAEGEGEDDQDDLFADLEIEVEEPAVEAESETDSFVLPGIDEPVPLEELKNGYLRQADYTRKTQELAAQRESSAKAVEFWQALTSRPQDVARQLAEAAGLIEPGAQPVKAVDLPFRPEEDIQAEVEQKLAEALESHPDILEAQKVVAERWIESEFSRIEEAYSAKLGPKSRELILKTAYAKQVDDLEMVFQALLSKQQDQARQRESLKLAAPAKPTGKATAQTVTEDPEDFWEAAMQAAAETGTKLNL